MKTVCFCLFALAALVLPGHAQTSPAYRKDALALASLQQRALAAVEANDATKSRALMRLESGSLLKFSKKYQYYVVRGAVPTSNLLLGSTDETLALTVSSKDPAKRKQLTGQARKTLSDARRLIEQGK